MPYCFRILNQEALKRSQEMYDQIMANRMGDRRKVHQNLRDKLLLLLSDLHQYIKGIQKFDSTETQGQLTSFLLKSVGGEIVEIVKCYVAQNKEHNSEVLSPKSNINFNFKLNLIIFQSKSNQFDKQVEDAIEKLQKSLTSKLIDDFHEAVDELLSSVDVIQKKNDRKKERYLNNIYT